MNAPTSTITLEQALQRALAYHQAGQLAQAEALCRQILTAQPNNPDALHRLGMIAYHTSHFPQAVELISNAIAVQADNPVFHLGLGEAYRCLGQLDEAIACYRRALQVAPGSAAAHFHLGALRHSQGQMDEAIASYRKALALAPDYAPAHSNLGLALHHQGQLEEAIACYERALAINPVSAEARYNLGITLLAQEKFEEAIPCFQKAIALRPDYVEAHNNLGAAFFMGGRLDEAVPYYQKAIALKPDYPEAHKNLGAAFQNQGQLDEAILCHQKAVQLRPDYVEAHNYLGTALFIGGRIAPALASLRQAVRHNPQNPLVHSSLLYTMLFDPQAAAEEIYAAHQEWNQRFAVPLRSARRPHSNDPNPSRRLKIGYVSPDFYAHVQGFFLVPLFESHDHAQVEVYCYASVRRPDNLTQRLKQGVDVWRDARWLSDEELAEQIRADGIDVLVDLTMHMTHNRLPVFARKPAPVQVSWLAYPGTTGLQTIDYRLTDPYLDPPNSQPVLSSEQPSGEQAIRLPDSFWCYDPLSAEPAVNALPALSAGHVTFGCLNNFGKINPPMLALWARVLSQVPGARLLLLTEPGSHRERTRDYLQTLGIAGERVEFAGRCQRQPYLKLYHQVDLMLDTVPYNGHTTSLDALWMGVPVVSLVGTTVVGRGGVSILSNIGLPELIAYTEDEYVRIAVELATDLPRLAELRATLRARLQASPLMDGPRFARNMEAAYRQMWNNWCRQKRGEPA